METKKVKVKQQDANEVTKLQILTAVEGGALLFGPHPKPEDRVKVPDGTKLEVLSAPVTGGGTSHPQYYFITDSAANGNFRRYYIKVIDTVAA